MKPTVVMAYLMSMGVKVDRQDEALLRAFYQDMTRVDFGPAEVLAAFEWFRYGWNARGLEF